MSSNRRRKQGSTNMKHGYAHRAVFGRPTAVPRHQQYCKRCYIVIMMMMVSVSVEHSLATSRWPVVSCTANRACPEANRTAPDIPRPLPPPPLLAMRCDSECPCAPENGAILVVPGSYQHAPIAPSAEHPAGQPAASTPTANSDAPALPHRALMPPPGRAEPGRACKARRIGPFRAEDCSLLSMQAAAAPALTCPSSQKGPRRTFSRER